MVWGIDPGVSGALALFDGTEGVVEAFDMPVVEINGKKQVHAHLVCQLLRSFDGPVWIERVSARPGQGVTSMFNFGKSYGTILGIVAALEYPLNYVTPQQWQKTLKVQGGKDAGRARAAELMPAYAHLFSRKKDDGRADAALIAFYGFSYGRNVDYDDRTNQQKPQTG
jgi:crossover junction endodeoxyribonuclease RuvC